MYLESLFQKTFQYSPNTYCIVQKPKHSFYSDVNFVLGETYFTIGTNLSKEKKKFQLSGNNAKYPNLFFNSSSLKDYSIEVYEYNYATIIDPQKVSLFLKVNQNLPIRYYMTYLFDKKKPSLIGGFKVSDDLRFSCHLQDDSITMFYKIDFSYRSFLFFGLKFIKARSSSDSLDALYLGAQFPLFDSVYTCGVGMSEPLEISVAHRKNNTRITYIFRNDLSMTSNYFQNYHYLQYKYKIKKLGTLATFYDFENEKAYSRCSLKLGRFLSVHFSSCYKDILENKSLGFKFHCGNEPINIGHLANYFGKSKRKNVVFDPFDSHNPYGT